MNSGASHLGEVPTPTNGFGLTWVTSAMSAVDRPSGYADEARSTLLALERGGCRPATINIRPSTQLIRLPRELGETFRVQELRRYPMTRGAFVHHYMPNARQADFAGAANIARTMFEADPLPEAWIGPLLERDAVWVPSRHNIDVFARSGVPREKLHLVGQCTDPETFHPAVERMTLDSDGRFVFLSVFYFTARKGWKLLIDAWSRAFAPTDPVRLVVKTRSATATPAQIRAVVEAYADHTGGCAPITVLARTLGYEEMPGLYGGADAFVSASHGEGWGRPCMQAMLVGRPTIAPAHGGSLEFMSPETEWLVPGEVVRAPAERADALDGMMGMYAGRRWFQADVDSLADAMRAVASAPAAARARAERGRLRVLSEWNEATVVAQIRDGLARLGRARVDSPHRAGV